MWYSMGKRFKVPTESEEVKNALLYMWVEIGKVRLGDNIPADPEQKDIWSGGVLPEYLWSVWKDELSKNGFTHRKFMRLMKYRADDMLLWVYDRIPWRELVDRIIDSVEGPIGKAIVEDSPLHQRLSKKEGSGNW